MAADDNMLKEMARHRGFRVVKSRKRTPGIGDYGRYGLLDAKGKEVIGFSKEGLTASPEEIETYLRGGEVTKWKQSAATARPLPRKATAQKSAPREPRPTKQRRSPPAREKPKARSAREQGAAPASEPAPSVPLVIRHAEAGDAKAIARFLSQMEGIHVTAQTVSKPLTSSQPFGAAVADRGGVVGVVTWTVLPTFHSDLVGRITLVVVDEKRRREGIGRALMEQAEEAMRMAGCKTVEAISNIEIRSSYGFFRKLGFDQTSYRYAKPLTAQKQRRASPPKR